MKNNKTNKNHKKTNNEKHIIKNEQNTSNTNKQSTSTTKDNNHKETNKPLSTNNTRFLDLTLDAVFKHFFKTNKNLCANLIQQFIPPLKHRHIKVLKFLDSQLHSQNPKDKNSLLDILVQIDHKELINIEMQCFRKKDFNERVLFYWAKLFIRKVKSGINYSQILPTYSLIFTDYTLFKSLKNYFSSFSLRCDSQTEVVFSDHLKISLVELNKFKPSKSLTELDGKGLWCYLLTRSVELTEEEIEVIASRSKMMKQAVDQLEEVSRDEALQILADAREKARMDKIAELDYSREEGLAKGLEKGRLEGMEKGRQEGMEKGRLEGRQEERREVILNMLKKKTDITFISEVTGLSVEEIKKLKNGS